jgi:hypothetical protein
MKLITATLLAFLLVYGCSRGRGAGALTAEEQKAYAAELIQKELYAFAVEAYNQALVQAGSRTEAANICYLQAGLLQNKMFQYEAALAKLLQARQLAGEGPLAKDINKNIVACLEKLQRSQDAVQELSAAADGEGKTSSASPVAARIGAREIRQNEISRRLGGPLPQNPDTLRMVIQQYVAAELMANLAERRGYADDPEIRKRQAEFARSLMVQKVLADEMQNIRLDTLELKAYHQSRYDRYTKEVKDQQGRTARIPKTFDEARGEVVQDYLREKQQSAYQGLMERLFKAEDVKFIQ